ncbi:MAG: hypothetical protein WD883_03210 [Candidatus Colwellbacteria bacterium]
MGHQITRVRTVVRCGSSKDALRDTENISVISKELSTGVGHLWIAEGPITRTHPSIAGFIYAARRWAMQAGFFDDEPNFGDEPTFEDLQDLEAEELTA